MLIVFSIPINGTHVSADESPVTTTTTIAVGPIPTTTVVTVPPTTKPPKPPKPPPRPTTTTRPPLPTTVAPTTTHVAPTTAPPTTPTAPTSTQVTPTVTTLGSPTPTTAVGVTVPVGDSVQLTSTSTRRFVRHVSTTTVVVEEIVPVFTEVTEPTTTVICSYNHLCICSKFCCSTTIRSTNHNCCSHAEFLRSNVSYKRQPELLLLVLNWFMLTPLLQRKLNHQEEIYSLYCL